MVIDLKCEQSDDLAEGCQIATKLGNEFHSQFTPGETADAIANQVKGQSEQLAACSYCTAELKKNLTIVTRLLR